MNIVGYEVVWTTPMGGVSRALFLELAKAQQYALTSKGVIYPLVRAHQTPERSQQSTPVTEPKD